MHQATMSGPDWLSDRDKKSQARREAARKKSGQNCAKKLQAAADALSAFSLACEECNDGSGPRRIDDSRRTLERDITEYAGWLESKYGA